MDNDHDHFNIKEKIFTRTRLLIGDEGMERLEHSHVTVCGVGGVGSYVVESLARAGIGSLTLIDFDIVAYSNINRQLPALITTVGEYKVDVLVQRIALINPDCQVTVKREKITSENLPDLLSEKPDYLVDAIDDLPAKVALIRYCLADRIKLVSAMGAGNKIYPEQLKIADISQTKGCPLAKALRKQLREYGIEEGFLVVYSEEKAPAIKVNQEVQRPITASISFVPSVSGLMLASIVVRDLIGLDLNFK